MSTVLTNPPPTPYMYIGPGLPVVLGGFPVLKVDATLIEDSILQILGTHVGERFFNPTFGSRVDELVFEPEDVVLKALSKEFIIDAVTAWETRITITYFNFLADTGSDTGLVNIQVNYIINKMGGLSSTTGFNIQRST